MALVRQVLQAQEYWRLKGLSADVVILNEDPTSYLDEIHAQLTALHFFAHRRQRHQRIAKARFHQPHDGRDGAHAVHLANGQPGLAVQLLERQVRLRSGTHGDGRMLQQRGQLPFVRRRRARGPHPPDRHRQARRAGDALAHGRVRLQGDIDAAGAQGLVQALGGLGGDLHLDARIGRLQVPQEIDQPGMHHALDGADAHQPQQLVAGAPQYHDLPLQLQQPLAIAKQAQAHRRQPQVPRLALEHARTDLLLQRGNAIGHGGLGDVQLLGRRAKAA